MGKPNDDSDGLFVCVCVCYNPEQICGENGAVEEASEDVLKNGSESLSVTKTPSGPR